MDKSSVLDTLVTLSCTDDFNCLRERVVFGSLSSFPLESDRGRLWDEVASGFVFVIGVEGEGDRSYRKLDDLEGSVAILHFCTFSFNDCSKQK